MHRPFPQSHIGGRALQRAADAFNAAHPVGTRVVLTKDNGEEVHTKTTSGAWVLAGHSVVVKLLGISGCYAVARVRKDEEVPA